VERTLLSAAVELRLHGHFAKSNKEAGKSNCKAAQSLDPPRPNHLQISTTSPCKGGAHQPFFRKESEVTMHTRTTVLYVDDNPKSSRLLSSVLQECGFQMITVNDPIEALALCKSTYFDLALLDYEMPSMSGSELAQEMKFLVPDAPVVLLSGRHFLPKSKLAFVDAHFGFGTSLDDLLWTMRILTRPKTFTPHDHFADHRAMTQWADST
jgi:CheY-like chemotaxis protein